MMQLSMDAKYIVLGDMQSLQSRPHTPQIPAFDNTVRRSLLQAVSS
jgi:hypothetical protein